MKGASSKPDPPRDLTHRAFDKPRALGRYELIMPLAVGGMATVYLGRTQGAGGFERLVAVKVCHPHLSAEPKYLKMFLDEARLAGFISHPNVVPTLDVDDSYPPFLVMEYVEGTSLSDLLKSARKAQEPLPVGVVLRIFCDALEGLQAAHDLESSDGQLMHVIHRDVSPQNILVGIDGRAKLTDFGVAKAKERMASTEAGEVKGKFAYMAPEQLSSKTVTPKVDVFSTAVTLWEALTGRRLFAGETAADTISLVLSGPIRWPSTYREGVPKELDRVVMQGLSRDPGSRFQRPADFADGLLSCGASVAAPEEVGQVVLRLAADKLGARREAIRAVHLSDAQPESSEQAPTESETVSLAPSNAVLAELDTVLQRGDDEPQTGESTLPTVVLGRTAEPRRPPLLLVALGILVFAFFGLSTVGVWWLWGDGGSSARPAPDSVSPPAKERSQPPDPPVPEPLQPQEQAAQPEAPSLDLIEGEPDVPSSRSKTGKRRLGKRRHPEQNKNTGPAGLSVPPTI